MKVGDKLLLEEYRGEAGEDSLYLTAKSEAELGGITKSTSEKMVAVVGDNMHPINSRRGAGLKEGRVATEHGADDYYK